LFDLYEAYVGIS